MMDHRGEDSSRSIQKLIIAHWKLAELSTGKALSDGASEESLREEVLYYYNGLTSLNQWTASSSIEKTRESISFNGLCKALYHFSDAIASRSMQSLHQHDSTQEIYLGDSVLIFVAIEPQSIVAIVQASRTVTPSAVRASLDRSHGLFCLLRGGGIHRRLCSEQEPAQNEFMYSQIEPVYRHWKQLSQEEYRKMRSSGSEDGHPRQGLIDLIDHLYETVPIIPLRRDLRIHYDAYVGELNHLARAKGMLRTLTEDIPAPAYRVDGEHARYSLPLSAPLEHIHQMQDAVATFLKSQDKDMAYMLHASCIYNGRIMFRNGFQNSEVSGETVSMTWNYMQHIRFQMLSLRMNSKRNSRSSTPTGKNRTFSQLMLSLGKRLEDAVQLAPLASFQDNRCYLPPPPLALLSTLDKADGAKGPSEGSMVWCLPVSFVCRGSDLSLEAVDAYASMYCLGEMSFLLFWKHGNHPKPDHSALLFSGFESSLSDALQGYPFHDLATNNSSGHIVTFRQPEKWQTEGADIIFIDRELDNLTLFSDPSRHPVTKTERGVRSPPKPGSSTPPKPHSEYPDLSTREFDHFDCRHLLTVNLASEVILCLEDALETITKATSDTLPLETCTFLPQGWLYVLKDKKLHRHFELYIIFDVSKFVTLTEVEIAAREICRNIIVIDEECGKL